MRQLVHSMVEAIAPLDPEEIGHREDAMAWVASGAEIIRTAKPATPQKHLVSYCVLVDGENQQLLLVDHRDAQLWLPTGGHVEPGEHPANTAEREIEEELGLQPEFLPSIGDVPLMVTVTETAGLSQRHTDVSLWFAFAGSQNDTLSPDQGEFVDTRWWSFDDIAHQPGSRFDPHLPRFVEKLRRRLA